MTFDKTPPASEEAEQGVLGCIVMDNSNLTIATEMLVVSDFYRPCHRIIFGAMIELSDKGSAVDILTLVEKLRVDDKIKQAGGEAYVAVLPDSVPASSHIKAYAKIVKDKAILRNIITAGQQMTTLAYEEKDVEETINDAQAAVFALTARKNDSAIVPLKKHLPAFLDEIDAVRTGKRPPGIPTGYVDIDNILAGLHPGDLIILAGRPKMGKTTLALNIACNVAFNNDISALFCSLEMSTHAILTKIFCADASIDVQRVRTGHFSEPEFAKIQDRVLKRQNCGLFIDDTPALTTGQFKSKARRAKAEHDIGIIVVDYLQLMKGRQTKNSVREQEIADISQTLKAIAKELNIPVVALSQLNRKVEESKNREPFLWHLRESGAIEQDADVVIMIWEPPKDKEELFNKKIIQVKIEAQRNGPTGKPELLFLDDIGRFENYAK